MVERKPYAAWRSAALATVAVACLVAATAAVAQQGDARVSLVRGAAWAVSAAGETRELAGGSPVFVGERVTTAAGASVQLAFTDGTRVALGAAADMILVDYRRDDEAFLVGVAKGAFRIITGLIGKAKPQAVRVNLTVGTIGIRGTHFGGEVDETRASVVLLEPEEPQASGIEVFNAFGAVTIEEPGFGTEIPDASSPPSPPRRMRLRAIDNLLRSLTSIPRPPPSIPSAPPRPPLTSVPRAR